MMQNGGVFHVAGERFPGVRHPGNGVSGECV